MVTLKNLLKIVNIEKVSILKLRHCEINITEACGRGSELQGVSVTPVTLTLR